MPSAEDLRAVSASYDPLEDFITVATRQIEIAARTGLTYEYIDVPSNLTREKAKSALVGNFPNCQIDKVWFTNCFKVSWAK
uniref:Uncharacterized protein n=1 Tax=viral metagenome TaxID=1070528 RepID=A0A6C0AJS7_9ZZZZ